MKRNSKIILSILTIVIVMGFLFLGCTSMRQKEISKREIWRTLEYESISNLTIANNLLLFEAIKKDETTDCKCIYAVDKSTGQLVWSTEQLAQPHIKEKETDTEWKVNWHGLVEIVAVSLQDNTIYVTINYATFYALNVMDGRTIWSIDNIDGLNLFDTNFSKHQFFVINNLGNLLASEKTTGIRLWEQPVYQDLDNVFVRVSFHDAIVWVEVRSGNDNKTLAFNSLTGQKTWETSIAYHCCPRLYSADKFIVADAGYRKIDEGSYIAGFDIGTGDKVWERHFDEPYLTFSLPIADKNQVYVLLDKADENSQRIARLFVLDTQSGKTLWEFNGNFSHHDISYFVDNEIVYIGTEDGYVFAVDNETGKEMWKTFTSGFPSYFFLSKGTLIVAMEEDAIVGLDAKTGQEKWEGTYDTRAIRPQGHKYADPENKLRIYNGILYLASEKPDIHAVSSASGETLWSWKHNTSFPWHRGYRIELLDDDVLYVVGGGSSFDIAGSGLFALKADP